MELKAGKAVAEKGGIIYLTEAKEDNVSIEENGGKFVIPAGVSTDAVLPAVVEKIGYTSNSIVGTEYDNSKRSNSAYEISNLAELEQFRDLVNGGFSFKGCTVKLTSDITLNDGWTPIGEGNRSVGATKYAGNYGGENAIAKLFKGEFDGNDHTINNLNNINYKPRFTYDETKAGNTEFQYSYGFFGILADGAYVHNLKLTGVSIDVSKQIEDYKGNYCYGDSVGALVGFCDKDVTISTITVNGIVKAHESCAGIVGRAYPETGSLTIENCTNNAEIICDGKAAGIVGTLSKVNAMDKLLIKDNSNTGSIKSNATYIDGGKTIEKSSGYHKVAGLLIYPANVNALTTNATITGNTNSGKLFINGAEVVDSLITYTGTKQELKQN